MTEGRRVLAGFGAMAFVMVAATFYIIHGVTTVRTPVASDMHGPIGDAFLATNRDARSNRSVDVGKVLPVGMSAAAALSALQAEAFTCRRDAAAASCARSVEHMSSMDTWTVHLTFDDAGKLRSSAAEWSATSL